MELITGKTGVPHVYAADDAELYRLFLGDLAYVLPTGNKLNAVMNGASKIQIFDGSLIVQGRLAKIRQTSGYDELDLAAGVIGQKRVDLVVAEYKTEQEIPIDAYIVGEAPLAVDWLSLTDGGQPFVPEKGQLYKLMNTVEPYEEDTYYRWMGNVYVQSIVQELEHLDTKIVQGDYNATTYIEPEIITGDINKGETHQVKLWAVRFNGINVDGDPIDYRTFLTGTPFDTLMQTSLTAINQIRQMIMEMSQEVLTGHVFYSATERLDEIQSDNMLEFDIQGMSYAPQTGDTIELYINGLKTNIEADGYTMSVEDNTVTFTFPSARTFTANDYGEIVIRR